MSQSPLQILAPTTGGGTSSTFEVGNGCTVAVSLSGPAAALAGGETASVQYLDADNTWRTMNDLVPGTAPITAGKTTVYVRLRGTFRVVLSATLAATGIEIAEAN